MLETKHLQTIYIPKNSKVGDVIRHILTIHQRDKILGPAVKIIYPNNPEAYELRLIDEDKEYFTPLFEVGALDRRERIGNYESLALVQVKNFKPKPSAV